MNKTMVKTALFTLALLVAAKQTAIGRRYLG